MVNSAKYERNSKKELIVRLSQEALGGGTDSDFREGGNGADNDVDVSPVSDDLSSSDSLPGVKEGRRILVGRGSKSGEDGAGQSNSLIKGLGALVLAVTLIAVGIGVRSVINSAPEEDELPYLGVLPDSDDEEIVQYSPAPTSVCTRVADISTDIGAESYYAIFADSFSVAYAQLPNEEAPFASIVKLLAALVIVDAYDLEQEIALKKDVDAEGNGIDLEVGEKVKVKDLLAAALIGSKNDAMYALVQNYPGGEDAFISKMDEKRLEIGMTDTSIVNPIGLDDPGQYSTPRDVAILMIVAMRVPVISELVSLPSYTIVTDSGREEVVYTTNTLLTEVPGVIGGKTGYTAEAGLSLVTYVDDETDFVTVVFNAEDRYEASKLLIDAVRNGYDCR